MTLLISQSWLSLKLSSPWQQGSQFVSSDEQPSLTITDHHSPALPPIASPATLDRTQDRIWNIGTRTVFSFTETIGLISDDNSHQCVTLLMSRVTHVIPDS